MRLVRTRDRVTWNALATAVPGGSAVHEWDFLDLQERLLGVEVHRYLVLDGTEVVGLVPSAIRRGRLLRSAVMPFPSLGPVVAPQLLLQVAGAIRRHQLRHGPVFARLDLAPEMYASAIELEGVPGLRVERDETVVVNTSGGSAEAVAAGFERSRRRQLRQAMDQGIRARVARPGEMSAILDRVVDQAYAARRSGAPYPPGSGQQIEEWARGRDDVYTASILAGETLIGGVVSLTGHSRVLAWLGGTSREYRHQDPGSVMIDHVLAWSAENGHASVDLAGRVDEGVVRFKKSFGGVITPYARVEVFAGPAGARQGLRALRSLPRRIRPRAASK